MFQKPLAKLVQHGKRTITKNNPKSSVINAIEEGKKEDYYKHLGTQNENENKPSNWNTALPYEAIPGPKPIPVLGNMFRFLPRIGEFYNLPLEDFNAKLKKDYGNVVRLTGIIGRRDMIFLYDPNDTEMLLRNEGAWPIRKSLESFVHYRTVTRKNIFKGVGGVLSVQGEDWFKFRSIVNPVLIQPKTVKQYVDSMDEVAGQFVENIKYFSTLNEKSEMPPDFLNEIYKWALESMGVIALDKQLGCLNLNKSNPESQKLINSVVEMFECMYKLDVLPSLWRTFSTPTWKKYVEILDFLTNTTLKYINEAIKNINQSDLNDHDRNILKKLVQNNPLIATAMAMDMIIAGIDTTGRTMGAALYFLARYPEKQQILRDEIIKQLPHKNSPVTQEILLNTPYLRAVIKETLRISPVAVGVLRSTVKDIVLGDYQVPKGIDVIGIQFFTSNSDKYFKDSKEFIPERWLRTTNDEYSYKNVHPFAYLPFGFGPRSCIGKRLANLELEVGIAKIIRNFKLSWEHKDMTFASTLLYGIADPLKLQVSTVD